MLQQLQEEKTGCLAPAGPPAKPHEVVSSEQKERYARLVAIGKLQGAEPSLQCQPAKMKEQVTEARMLSHMSLSYGFM